MSKALTAVIVDDEPLALEGLKLRLEKIPEIEVIGQASDGDEAINLCHELCPDVLFLDLRLPGLNGIEVVQSLQSDILPMVVFVSAYGEYALEAFELNAIDYVLKPANLGRLQKTVERILQRHNPQQPNNEKFRLLKALGESSGIPISELENWLESNQPLPTSFCQELVIKNSDNEKVFLPVKEIRWIDAAGDYMCVHTDQETHIVRITMKKLESQLDERVFKRIHKSTLVNINCIKSIRSLRNSESLLELGDDVHLKVSRNYSSAIQELLESKQV
ncbi:LytR/AlgR family response regulator transcription factor [Thalassotalea sp. PLHSN55]|uniref:LytR/AlgR family response regulator transcription factor n=1 Tax=Thalassotalea sp. PLHSN55 TaxID=3435888 RepID=UPI003F860B54